MQASSTKTKGKTQLRALYFEQSLPWLVLAVLFLYNYAKFFEHPYYGFRWETTTRKVFAIYIEQKDINPSLEIKDKMIQIGPMLVADFEADLLQTIFDDVKKGEIIPLVVERDGQELTIPWTYPGQNWGELVDLLFNEGWLAFGFWLAGTFALFNLHPKDERWLLMIAFNYLTALWLVFGSGPSHYHIWGSAVFLRMFAWMCVPVYLHLHWVFPKPLGKLPPALIRSIYLIAPLLALSEPFQILPQRAYLQGFLIAVFGSVVLLIAHAIVQPDTRRDLRLLWGAAILALVPSVLIGLISLIGDISSLSGGSSLPLLILPLAYFYSAYRRQLSGLEMRVNHLISNYIFISLLFTGISALIVLGTMRAASFEDTIFVGISTSILAAVISIWGLPKFQNFVEHRLLNISIPHKNLSVAYSSRITTSATIPHLIQLLKDEVLPSLPISQFVFLQSGHSMPKVLLALGVKDNEAEDSYTISDFIASMGKTTPDSFTNNDEPHSWVHLTIPLKIGEETIGLWFFGRHDSDDTYSQEEIAILQTLANQTAIALSNILQTERLKAIYEADINRYEEQRVRLALTLHDSILNQLAILSMNLDPEHMSPAFQQAYERITAELREIVSDLRPPMLDYGLKPAFEELADNMMERTKDKLNVTVDIETDGARYPSKNMEEHLFRITQESCENSLRYAQAKNIRISGRLFSNEISLAIEDDGIGFEIRDNLEVEILLKRKHFGLANIMKRAHLIGGEAFIQSEKGKGTRIQIIRKSASSFPDS